MPKKKSKPSAVSAKEKPVCFEDALEELEGIVEEMQGDRVPLEKLLKKYERGTTLLQQCQEHIGSARVKVEQISARMESGVAGTEAFDGLAGGGREAAGETPTSEHESENTTPDDDIQLL